jgi:glucose/arabinose dehydrogenase
MKTVASIGLMTVLSAACGAALAQQPAPKEPTQQTAPRAQATPRTEPAPATSTATTAANAARDAASQHMALQTMDTNKDGLVSKAEYLAHYEGQFGKMKKDSAGMINLKDLG